MTKMVEVTHEDANNYCRVLTALGMEEDGDPVARIEELKADEARLDWLLANTGLILGGDWWALKTYAMSAPLDTLDVPDWIDRRVMQAEAAGAHTMWAVHVQGPDELHACPDRATADALALVLNRQFQRFNKPDDPVMAATVTEWPYGYEAWKTESEQLQFEAVKA